jgi:hypothetical protein
MVAFFDNAFRLRMTYPDAPVLLYALGILFKIRYPSGDAETVAISCITQCLLIEPGVAQKAFALLSFWRANGLTLDVGTIAGTIAKIIARHDSTGLSSDVAWALFFCLESKVMLDRASARHLSEFRDDAIAIQALHLEAEGLFPGGFAKTRLLKELAQADPNEEHWLGAYECVRQGQATNSLVSKHPVYGEMLRRNVAFYRTTLPPYASLLHPGGAPEWAINALLSAAAKKPTKQTEFVADSPVVALLEPDLSKIDASNQTFENLVAKLFGDDYQGVLDVLGDATTYP